MEIIVLKCRNNVNNLTSMQWVRESRSLDASPLRFELPAYQSNASGPSAAWRAGAAA
jgi:hypothetical protein